MPQINRLRIINFSYNNDSRHITDEIFDFYQGENALLNLKNGGGKSVLVQLMMQPIVPKTKLMGRRIEDFFKGRKTPSYILIEWKLEDQGGYLLTGICIANRESQTRYQDESNYSSLKHFTFTSTYISSNKFDILNIPFVKKQDERIYIEEYKEARNIINSAEGKYNTKFFDYDDRLEYNRHLNSFNISQDEWKTIILKINESEGGVIEIFEKCRTSQQLMNDWILKTVEKVVNKDEEDLKKLEIMLENLVDDMIENEQYIYEKEIFGNFLQESKNYFEKVNDLVLSIDKEEKLMKKMANLYYYLKREIDKINVEVESYESKIKKSEEELSKIDLEEKSKEYYDIEDKIKNLRKIYEEEMMKLEALSRKIEKEKRDELVLKASGEFLKLNELKRESAGLSEEIRKIKNSEESKERIRDLEYSLKIRYEEELKKLNEKESEIQKYKNEILKIINNFESEIVSIDRSKDKLHGKEGKLKADINAFEKYEEKLKAELKLKYNRNLLHQIEEEFEEKYLSFLNSNIEGLIDKKERTNLNINSAEEEIVQIDTEIKTLGNENSRNPLLVENIDEKISEYYRLEESLKPVLDRHDIQWKRRFNHKENSLILRKHLNELKSLERNTSSNKSNILNNIYSIKKGTLHLSDEFVEFLIEEDILFETGENYLKNQEERIKEKLIKENPMLPYTFIFDKENLEKLKDCKFDLSIYQIIPITTYSRLNNKYKVKNKWVEFKDDFNFICLFNNRILNEKDLELYLEELNKELDLEEEKLSHYISEVEKTEEGLQILINFIFDDKYLYNLENKKDNILKKIKENTSRLNDLEKSKNNLTVLIKNHEKLIKELEDNLRNEKDKIIKIEEFFLKNEEYVSNINERKSISEEISEFERRKEKLNIKKKETEKKDKELVEESVFLERNINTTKIKLETYKDSPKGSLIEESIEDMEEGLRVLKSNITRNLAELERQKIKNSKKIDEKELLLKSFEIDRKEYTKIPYDYRKLIDIQKKIRLNENEEKLQNKNCQKINLEISREEGKFDSIKNEIEKIWEGPLEPSQIKLNFKERRTEENKGIKIGKNKISELNKKGFEYNNISTQIQVKIEIQNYKEGLFIIDKNPKEDYDELKKELKEIMKENEVHEKNARSKYYDIKSRYVKKNVNIDNIFSGLDILINKAESDNDNYIKLGERILNNNELMENLIKACENRLSNLEKSKKDMIKHSYLQGKQVYEEIQKISENSSVKLEGKSRSIPMLRIKMEELEEAEEDNILKMRSYIENCIGIIKQDMKDNIKSEDIRKKINKYMSTKELLNVISDLGKMSISAYKIDLNSKNSGYKKWEQVMKENSGGERFVSFFAVLVALMSYTRTSAKAVDDYKRNRDTKVLIMDNPFGPISSEHLLKPLFSIAEKYNTQLICLTDLKQNSILNCFDLIYMIKIRQNIFGTDEYLQLEKQIKGDSFLEQDEMLEKAVFKEQITLL